MLRPPILVLQIVGILPNVNAKRRLTARLKAGSASAAETTSALRQTARSLTVTFE